MIGRRQVAAATPRPQQQPVVGIYDRIEVKPTSVIHGQKEIKIDWINQFAFYFRLDEQDKQIWIFDPARNCLHQIRNSVPPDMFQRVHNKHTPTTITSVGKNLGNFKGTNIQESTIGHAGQTRPITWINPLAFYFKWDGGNEQVWIYDATVNGYLQMGRWDASVDSAYTHVELRVYPRV